jgi:hypothetical protein
MIHQTEIDFIQKKHFNKIETLEFLIDIGYDKKDVVKKTLEYIGIKPTGNHAKDFNKLFDGKISLDVFKFFIKKIMHNKFELNRITIEDLGIIILEGLESELKGFSLFLKFDEGIYNIYLRHKDESNSSRFILIREANDGLNTDKYCWL